MRYKSRESKVEALRQLVPESVAVQTTQAVPAIAIHTEPVKDEQIRVVEKPKKASYANLCVLMRQDFGSRLKVNVLDGRIYIDGVGWEMNPHPLRDYDRLKIQEYFSEQYDLGGSKSISEAIRLVAGENSFHPIRDLLDTLVWDGVPRLANLFPRYLGAEPSEYTAEVTRLLLSALIQRVYNPGCKYDYCIILVDQKQGTGKSTMCRLVSLRDEWFTDGLVDFGKNEKAFESVQGKWVVEIGEMLATRRARDVETIKSYISRTSDVYRVPYTEFPEVYPRRCVMIGTTNKAQFLPDDKSGNRRFIPLICDGDKAERHPLADEQETRQYIRQCFAEMMERGKTEGYRLTLDPKFDAEIEQLRGDSTPEDSRIGIIQEWLDHTKDDFVCSQMIWDELFSGSYEKPATRQDLKEIAEILSQCIEGWERYAGKNGSSPDGKYRFKGARSRYGIQRVWVRKNVPGDVPSDVPGDVPGAGDFVPSNADWDDITEDISL